ncbi:hypothetical protein CJF32_00011334 [Rutstroemia sp. NJR-2017a WRK4]|nr:hypothetical protein CJF32_00011334 [Rutstroemia sp. NJR-2017a WRK4]
MSQYQYPPLSLGPDSVRLLRLLPHEDKNAPIQCQLFDYSLQEPGKRTHLYDALSYVWGDSKNPRSIYIGEHNLPVTENLHAALSHLRNFSLERIVWVDAICIDQKNTKEKEQQIQIMTTIYSQANRVLVWLGEAADNSDQALEEIRAAGGNATISLSNETIQSAVLALLQRNWFQRIWVRKRHLTILAETTESRSRFFRKLPPLEIDGYAFCLGIDSLREFYEARVELQSLIRSVTYLIKGAIFRPNYVMSRTGGVSQAICTLGELIDMYHNHEATLLHDKIYALFGMSGMSSDDLSKANLLPNYEVEWEELLQRLAKFLLCERISIDTWSGKEIAVIKSKGCILGRISSVQKTISLDGRQGVDIIFKNISEQLGYREESSAHWTLQPSAKPIRDGDLICLLQGASKPTIIRLRKDHFVIIVIAASPLETGQTGDKYIKWPEVFPRDFLLVWDWEYFPKPQDLGEYDTLVRTNDWVSENSKTEVGGYLSKAARIWNVVMILDDLEEYEEGEERLREAIVGYEMAFVQEHLDLPKGQYGRTPLSWAAGNGYNTVVNILLETYDINPNLEDSQTGRTPLLWAAKNGHEAVVKLLLETGKVEVDSKDKYSQTPLLWAAINRHEAIVKLLLETGKVEIDSKDNKYSRTLLSWAAGNGYKAVVKLLLETGKVEIDSKDKYSQTPLLWAAMNGHEAIVKLLLETGKVEVESKDNEYGQTSLSWAAENGHEAVVKLLLETGKVEIESKDDEYSRTLLSWAAGNGYKAVVKLLLETGKVEIDSKDKYGRTPLLWAARNGHKVIGKLLLETGKVEIDSKDKYSQTSLLWAATNGHEAVVKLLLETGKAEIELKNEYGLTPLSWAVENGHEAVVKILDNYVN